MSTTTTTSPGSTTRVLPSVRAAVLDRDGWRCRWCGVKVHPRCSRRGCHDDATVDHLVHYRDDHARRNDPTNLVAACRWCNLSRGVGDRPRPRPGRTPQLAPQRAAMAGVGRR